MATDGFTTFLKFDKNKTTLLTDFDTLVDLLKPRENQLV